MCINFLCLILSESWSKINAIYDSNFSLRESILGLLTSILGLWDSSLKMCESIRATRVISDLCESIFIPWQSILRHRESILSLWDSNLDIWESIYLWESIFPSWESVLARGWASWAHWVPILGDLGFILGLCEYKVHSWLFFFEPAKKNGQHKKIAIGKDSNFFDYGPPEKFCSFAGFYLFFFLSQLCTRTV